MNVNLFRPYNTRLSEATPESMAFFAPSAPNLLFGELDELVIYCIPVQRGLALHWELCRNGVRTPLHRGRVAPHSANSFAIALDDLALQPGFYDLRVSVSLSETQQLTGYTTFGWRADDERIVETRPRDFDLFWNDSLSELARAPLDLKRALAFTLSGKQIDDYNTECAGLPEHYDPEGELYQDVEVYKVDFQSVQGRVYGWYAKPAGSGPFPAMLVLPGGGNTHRPAPVEHARHGYASLALQVHGCGIDWPRSAYPYTPDPTMTTPRDHVYHAIYLNSVKAVQALSAMPEVDPERIAICGGSQGARLGAAVAALEPRVRAVIPAIPHYAYQPWTRWVSRLNSLEESGEQGFSEREIPESDVTVVESYYDILNFAPWIRCPVLVNAGLTDMVSPATAVYAFYRALSAPKEIWPLPNMAHDWSPAFDTYAWRWLDGVLSRPPAPSLPVRSELPV